MSQDLYTLAAIAALESGSSQGQADVAQSVYNRLQDGLYGSSITDVLTRKSQYQPAFINPNASSGSGTNVAPAFKSITDENSAVAAMSYYYQQRNIPKSESAIRQQFRGSFSAIQNPTLQQNAKDFVGNATEFLSSGSNVSGAKWRGSGSDNKFFIEYGTAKNKAGGNPTAEIPTSISQGSVSQPTSPSPTPDQQAVAKKEKIKISNPKELSQEALNNVNVINAQVDVINKLIKI